MRDNKESNENSEKLINPKLQDKLDYKFYHKSARQVIHSFLNFF